MNEPRNRSVSADKAGRLGVTFAMCQHRLSPPVARKVWVSTSLARHTARVCVQRQPGLNTSRYSRPMLKPGPRLPTQTSVIWRCSAALARRCISGSPSSAAKHEAHIARLPECLNLLARPADARLYGLQVVLGQLDNGQARSLPQHSALWSRLASAVAPAQSAPSPTLKSFCSFRIASCCLALPPPLFRVG